MIPTVTRLWTEEERDDSSVLYELRVWRDGRVYRIRRLVSGEEIRHSRVDVRALTREHMEEQVRLDLAADAGKGVRAAHG